MDRHSASYFNPLIDIRDPRMGRPVRRTHRRYQHAAEAAVVGRDRREVTRGRPGKRDFALGRR